MVFGAYLLLVDKAPIREDMIPEVVVETLLLLDCLGMVVWAGIQCDRLDNHAG